MRSTKWILRCAQNDKPNLVMLYLLLGLAAFALLFLLTISIDRMERWDHKD